MTDLKIIDELLCLWKRPEQSWAAFEQQYNVVHVALSRLRQAYRAGEMPEITASLAHYIQLPV